MVETQQRKQTGLIVNRNEIKGKFAASSFTSHWHCALKRGKILAPTPTLTPVGLVTYQLIEIIEIPIDR